MSILGVAGMDAKIDSKNRVQVAFTEEGSAFTSLQYIFRDAQGNWSAPFEIDGPSTDNYNVGVDVAMDIDSNDEPTFVYYNGENGTQGVTKHLLTHFTTINYVNIRISKLLRKDMNTRNPIKKLQYIIETVRFLTLLFLTKGLSSRSETSLSPIT